MRDEAGAIGSANAPFTLFVAGLALAIGAPFVVVLPRLRPAALTGVVLFLLVFGWLMPHMAGWTTFESDAPRPPPEPSDIAHA
jgi:hypothetical protein